MSTLTLDERLANHLDRMSPAEQRVAQLFQNNREEVLIASAASLAAMAGTSDATVVRTAKSLGFDGMDDLRQSLAAELKQNLNVASRLTETLLRVGDDLDRAFSLTLDIHRDSIDSLRRDITPEAFSEAITLIGAAKRVVVFGIGPSSAMADYFAIQLSRLGVEARSIKQTGLLFADDLGQLRDGDIVLAMAYTHVYGELDVLITESDRLGIKTILLTDSLGPKLKRRVDLVLTVARGKANMLSMHTATIGLLEALLVGIATKHPKTALKSLKSLNRLREQVVGKAMNTLPANKS